MANKKMVIAGSDNVTAKQLRELMNQIDLRVIKGSTIQDFLDNAKLFSLKPPRFDKHDIPNLVSLIMGKDEIGGYVNESDYLIPEVKFRMGKDIIMYAIAQFRQFVESWNRKEHTNHYQYYKECFDRLDDAKTDTKLAQAVAFLALSIRND